MAKGMSAFAPGDQAANEAVSESSWHTRCDRCGTAYDVDGWRKLALVTRVEPISLATHVTVWPSDAVVEVRRCARCARTVSRRRPQASDKRKTGEHA